MWQGHLNPTQKLDGFGSAKFVGDRQAHKCRNKNSNPRNNLKKKIKVIVTPGEFYLIFYLSL